MSRPSHAREGPTGRRELSWALLVTASFMLVEFVAAFMSGSLSLLADAADMLTDSSALSISLFAAWIARRPASPGKTYGYYRTEILAALINGVALCLLVIWIGARALQRLHNPPDVLTGPMLVAAVLGLAANLASSRILAGAGTRNLNIRGARINVIGDALGSCGVIGAGLLMRFKGWRHADPLASLLIGFFIAFSAWMLMKQAVNVLLESTPAHLDLDRILEAIREVEGVRDVHDLHLWTITTGLEAMSGHILVEDLGRSPQIVEALNRLVSERFGITHTTFQLELHRP